MDNTESLVPSDRIHANILILRRERVILDSTLASLYDVTTKALVQAVKRNPHRFPPDFMFQLNSEEFESLKSLRSQIVTSNRGGRRYPPYAFTEQGVAMLSSVLKSERAIAVNVEIMRAFVKLRRMLVGHVDLSRKLTEMERKYDAQFKVVFDAIRELMVPPPDPKKKPIGYHSEKET